MTDITAFMIGLLLGAGAIACGVVALVSRVRSDLENAAFARDLSRMENDALRQLVALRDRQSECYARALQDQTEQILCLRQRLAQSECERDDADWWKKKDSE